jgi:succinyl-CoA synthetase beta subunit
MSTLDVVVEHGGKAANFLDIGGGAKAETVAAALEVLETEDDVKSVLINIFGGITRCDLVAEGIVQATSGKLLKWPITVRLDGTNSKEGLDILEQNKNEKITISSSMDDAAKIAVQAGQ